MAERLNDLSGTEWLPATRSSFVDSLKNHRARLTWDQACDMTEAADSMETVNYTTITVMADSAERPPDKKLIQQHSRKETQGA